MDFRSKDKKGMHRISYFKYLSLFLLCMFSPAICSGAQSVSISSLRYLFSIDAKISGDPFYGVKDIFADNKNDELYLIDEGNNRVVITDMAGTFLYKFNYTEAGIKKPPTGIVTAGDGTIYIAEYDRIIITDYRGMYNHDMDLSTIPDKDKFGIQSIDIRDDYLYLGCGDRIIVMDRKEERFVKEFKEGIGKNAHIALDEGGIFILDHAAFTVFHLDISGKPLDSFGRISGLAGGFSMTADIAVDKKNGLVIVVDINRIAVIFFDRKGGFVFEIGGPQVFRMPRAVAVDDNNRVYVSDGSNLIRVFEIVTTPAIIEAKPEQIEIAPSIPVQESEPKTEDVAKMVAEEGMLLPVFFVVDSSNLTETDLDILNKNAEWLKKNADVKINVRGYADERGTDEYNVKLSERRAKAVMDYLIKQDVDANRLKFIGYGKELSTDKSEAGLARSRRVDFLVIR